MKSFLLLIPISACLLAQEQSSSKSFEWESSKDKDKTKAYKFQTDAWSLAFQTKSAARGGDDGNRDYERGMRALDSRQWDEAVARFDQTAANSKTHADAALYWKAYALAKLGRGKEALAELDDLQKKHAQSRWLNDAKAMRAEIAQAAGKPVSPEQAADDDIKLMAINSLMNSDPERSVPLLEKLLASQASPKLRERALFVLAQSDSPKAREAVVRVAKGGANPHLQLKAVQSLGIHGGKENRQLLADVYAASSDLAVKRQVLNSYMVAGERDRLLTVAKSDASPELRMAAIQYLGNMGAGQQLATLYSAEQSVEVRERIMRSLSNSGSSSKLIELAKTEKDPGLRDRAIRLLGTMNGPETGEALVAIYQANPDLEVRKRILGALFTQGSATRIVELARKETNVDLRRAAVQHLSHMKSKEGSDYLIELLNK